MKKLLFISLILFISAMATSCKKDPLDIPIGTIKVDINGSAATFNVRAAATNLIVTGGFGIQIQGNRKESSTTNLSFSIVRPNPIATGTYTENAGSNPLVIMTHCVEVITPCVFQHSAYGSAANPVSITITEITASSVRGTFKGELRNSNGTTTELLTNGVFYVRI